MNAIQLALKEAGIKTPTQMQRIWNYLKDNNRGGQGTTAKDTALAIGLSQGSVSSIITDMIPRGMVSYTEHVVRAGSKLMPVRFYVAEGNTYELLPRPKKGKKTTAKWRPTVPAFPKDPVVKAEPAKAPMPTSNIDHMTIGEARIMFQQLKEFFG